jgi:hypothetical protein
MIIANNMALSKCILRAFRQFANSVSKALQTSPENEKNGFG